jgi:hypothetical protein
MQKNDYKNDQQNQKEHKYLNVFKENKNKQLIEIRKTMQNMTKELNNNSGKKVN